MTSQPFPLASFFDHHPCGESCSEDEADLTSSGCSSGDNSEEEDTPVSETGQTPYYRLNASLHSKESEGSRGSGELENSPSSCGPISETTVCGTAERFDALEADKKREESVETEVGTELTVLNQITEAIAVHKEDELEEGASSCFSLDEDGMPALIMSDSDSESMDVTNEDGWESVEPEEEDYGNEETHEEEREEDGGEEEREEDGGKEEREEDGGDEQHEGEAEIDGEAMDIVSEEELFITSLLVGNLLNLAERHELPSGMRESGHSNRRLSESPEQAGMAGNSCWTQTPRVGGVVWKITQAQPPKTHPAPVMKTKKVDDAIRTLLWDDVFMCSLFELLPGVDSSDVYLQHILRVLRGPNPPGHVKRVTYL